MTRSALRATPDAPIEVITPGRVAYRVAWDWQQRLARRRAADEIGDTLLLLEHPPIYTLGRRADDSNIRVDEEHRASWGIDVERIDRGGDVTYHGPGQLVGYPIFKLAGPRVVDHVRALEDLGIAVAARFGVGASRLEGFSGAWVGDAKLMAIGVHVTAAWVTTHGFAFNVAPDMTHFGGIVACGIGDKGVCSLAQLGVTASMDDVIEATIGAVEDTWEADVRRQPATEVAA